MEHSELEFWVGSTTRVNTTKLTPCLTYAVPVMAFVQPPVLHLRHPRLIKLVHHNVLGFQHPKRLWMQKNGGCVCVDKHSQVAEEIR